MITRFQGIVMAVGPTSPGTRLFGWRLNDTQVASVLTFIGNLWCNSAPPV